MADITASLVKELREKTGAGMMDCKKALGEVAGDIEAAVDWLRKKGLSQAAKKAGRVAAEGLVGFSASPKHGALIEINAETDFVARNEQFQNLVSTVAGLVLTVGEDTEALKAAPFGTSGHSVGEEITRLVATIGENMSLRRASVLSVENGIVATYMHGALVPGLGKIGVLIALESTGDHAALVAFGRQLAMHVAAANPIALTVEEVDTAAVDRERNILADQARASGKPEEIIGKMVEGRLRKFYEEVVLLEQVYVIDGESKVKDAVKAAAKDVGAPVQLVAFRRFALGEGIEKETTDFAAEVAAQAAR